MNRIVIWMLPLVALAGFAASCGSTGGNSAVLGDDGGGSVPPEASTVTPSGDGSNPTPAGSDATSPGAEMEAAASDGAGADAANLDASKNDAADATNTADVNADAVAPTDASGPGMADADAARADATPDGAVSDAASAPEASPDAAEAATPDAGPFACHGAPLPTTAPATVSLSGQTGQLTLTGLTALAGVSVTALATSNNAAIGSATSDSNGDFSVTASTGGSPLDAYFRASKSGFVDAYYYPVAPFAADTSNVDFLIVTSTTLTLVADSLGVTQMAANSALVVMVVDCSGNPVSGATVSTSLGATVYYDGSGSIPSATATSTNTDGIAIVFNVPPGTITVGALSQGIAFRAHSVTARAGTLTLTRVAP
jgi:hypothetical protein